MEVLDRALFRHVSGAGSTEPVQKPISSTIKDGVQVDKFDLGNGGIAIVTCTGVTVSLSLGLQGKKLIDLNGGFGTTVTSCKITTIDKDGKIIDQKNADASDVDKGDVQIAENDIVRVVGQAKLFSFVEYPVQPYLLLGLGSFIWTGGRSAQALGLFRPGLGVDFYLTEHVVLSPVVYYELWFSSNDVEAREVVNVAGTLQFRF